MDIVKPPVRSGPHAGLLDWLADQSVEYVVHEHPTAETALETARAEQVDPRTVAKVVVVATDDHRALLVLDAPDRLDMAKARHVLAAHHVRLLTELELAQLAPDIEVGALPPIGPMWGLPVYADWAVRVDDEITFPAGSHRWAVRVDREAWERAAHVRYGDLAEGAARTAAWLDA
jgi:Ala-tRNA(Pro) deacylase